MRYSQDIPLDKTWACTDCGSLVWNQAAHDRTVHGNEVAADMLYVAEMLTALAKWRTAREKDEDAQ